LIGKRISHIRKNTLTILTVFVVLISMTTTVVSAKEGGTENEFYIVPGFKF
jgi:hypothetical protein